MTFSKHAHGSHEEANDSHHPPFDGGTKATENLTTLEGILEKQLLLASSRKDTAKNWEQEFGRYIELKQERLLRLAHKITGCWHASQDAVQEASIALHKQLFSVGFEGSISAWLITTTRNNALQHIRRESKRKTVPLDTDQAYAASPDDCPLEYQESVAEAWERIQKLPAQQQRVLVLRLVQEWEYDRIGKELNIKPAAAKSCFYKALDNLQYRSR